jgi:hypothetical protein
MKTPQVPHGVLDPKTGKEITTPLGIPRNAPTAPQVTDTFYTENGSLWCIVRIDAIKTWFGTVRIEYLAEEVENGARMWFDEDTVIEGIEEKV